ncbi:MAG: 2-hydroxychromene-2-carboxylate isomerase [Gammaproteobacteria bacterium]|nr:2-hydroxychromene-2-carboxylate isomerase [Gammaproteobacteria bacterium]
MSVTVEFHYDFGSPNTYYCHRVIPEIERRTGIRFKYTPVLLGGIFRSTNNIPPIQQFAEVKNKLEYHALETARFVKKHDIDRFVFNPAFPVNTLLLMRGAIFASDKEYYEKYIEASYQGMWELGLDMSKPDLAGKHLSESGLPAEEILSSTQSPDVKQQLIDSTALSVEKGNFGSPTFFVGNEMFFGKDRLYHVEEEIIKQLG